MLPVLISGVVGLGRLVHRSGGVSVSATFVARALARTHCLIICWWIVVSGWQGCQKVACQLSDLEWSRVL